MDAVHGDTAGLQRIIGAGPVFHFPHDPFLQFPRDGFLGEGIGKSTHVVQHHGHINLSLVLGDADIKANFIQAITD